MALVTAHGIEELKDFAGKEVGPSSWREVTQESIDRFVEIVGDHDYQWIHADVERAKRESPFGATIAPGNMTLSMTDGMWRELIGWQGIEVEVNYGWNKVRFPAPVPVGSRVRTRAQILSVDEVGRGWWQVATRLTVEVEGNDKPACVGEGVARVLPC